jgi:hypothetical protein
VTILDGSSMGFHREGVLAVIDGSSVGYLGGELAGIGGPLAGHHSQFSSELAHGCLKLDLNVPQRLQ